MEPLPTNPILTAPVTPLGARTPHTHPALYGVIAVLSLVIIAGAAWVFWPERGAGPDATASPTGQTPIDELREPRALFLSSDASGRYHMYDIDRGAVKTESLPEGYSLIYPSSFGRMPARMMLQKAGLLYLWDRVGTPAAIAGPDSLKLMFALDRAYASKVMNAPKLLELMLFDHRDSTDFGGGPVRHRFLVDLANGTAEELASISDRGECWKPDPDYRRHWAWPCGEGVGSAAPLRTVADGTGAVTEIVSAPTSGPSPWVFDRSPNGFLVVAPDGLYVVNADATQPQKVLYPWSLDIHRRIADVSLYSVSIDNQTKTIVVGGSQNMSLLRYDDDGVVRDIVTIPEPDLYGNFHVIVDGILYYPTPMQQRTLRTVDLRTRTVLDSVPIPTPVYHDASDDWQRFSSRFFTLSFQVPRGFQVHEEPDTIRVSYGPYETYEIGDDNAFMTIDRFTDERPKAATISAIRSGLRDIRESTIQVDGESFSLIEGTDIGRYEGNSAGQVFIVVFDKSLLYAVQWPRTREFDGAIFARYIIQTLRFSK